MGRLKVVHIQKSIFKTGRAALRLHNAFIEESVDSSLLTMEFDVNLTDKIAETGRVPRIRAKADGYLQALITRKINRQLGLFSFPILGTDLSDHQMVKDADIIYLHWVQGGFLNLSGYRKIARLGKPVIVFMHDMWTITGGCHHSFECEKFMSKCIKCPMFPERTIIDWVKLEFDRKKKLYSDFENFYFVSPSKWLLDCAKKSCLTKDKPVFHIPNLINSNLFKPIGRKTARNILGLPETDIIIGFGAFSISSPYKGWSELLKAIRLLIKDSLYYNLTVLIFGGNYEKAIADAIPCKTVFMGFLRDEYSTVLVYNAIDVFVTPSLADNFPTTVLECQSCGTPVTAFNVGGIPDMIIHRKNGYLAKYKDSEDLAEGIKFCIREKISGYLLPQFEKTSLLSKHFDLINTINKGALV